MTAHDPEACPSCGGTELIRVPDQMQPGSWITVSCPRCSPYAQRVQRMLADLERSMADMWALAGSRPRETPQHPRTGCPCHSCTARDDYLEDLAESRKEDREYPVSGREADRAADLYYRGIA